MADIRLEIHLYRCPICWGHLSYDSCVFGLGNLCIRTDESGSYDFEYDGFGNQTQMVKTELGVPYTTRYQYDDGDHLSQMTLPSASGNGRVIDYQRDGVIQPIDFCY